MNKPTQLVIIGGGFSVKEGLSLNLWDKLKGHFVIGTNYAYKFNDFTFNTFVDSTFYNTQKLELEKLPLIIGQCRNIKIKLPNTLAIPSNSVYNRDLKGGIHSAKLTGIYTLSLGIYLLDVGEIFLLGFDMGSVTKECDNKKRPYTHWYQDQFEHRGVGKTSYYDVRDRDKKDYGCFGQEKLVKIWNVSPLSKINVFEKIDYKTFFEKLNSEIFEQEELREYIKIQLKGKYT